MSFHFPSAVGQEQKVYRVTIYTFLTFPRPLLDNLERLLLFMCNRNLKRHPDARMCAGRIFLPLLISYRSDAVEEII